MNNPVFSVVITCYNLESYIKNTINSVLNQTFKDFEIIVVDDGSTDNTSKEISSIKDDRIYYVYQENSGLPACSRNRGILLSKGKYIAFLDGDDLWYSQKLEMCFKILEKEKGVALVCHEEAVRYKGKIIKYSRRGPAKRNMHMALLLKGNYLSPSAVVIRRDVFLSKDNMFSERKDFFSAEDYDLWVRLSKRFKFAFLKEILGEYTLFDENISTKNIERNTNNMLNILDLHFKQLDKDVRNSFIIRLLIAKRKSAILCGAARSFHRQKDFKKAKEWYKKSITEFPLYFKAFIGLCASLLKVRV